MNKKIYFNNKFILLQSSAVESSQDQGIKILVENEPQSLEKIINDFLNENGGISIQVNCKNIEKSFENLKKQFHYIEAAGGFIEKDKKFLFIHRHQRWDLPKGKLEKGESIKTGAMRECEEETGIKELSISHALSSTFHIYTFKNAYALKQTYWFYMQSSYPGVLTPQLEEDIDQVKWFSKEEIVSGILSDTYFTIHDLVTEALKL